MNKQCQDTLPQESHKMLQNPSSFPCQTTEVIYNEAQSIHKSRAFTNEEENT